MKQTSYHSSMHSWLSNKNRYPRAFWLCELNETDEAGYSCVQLFLDDILAKMYLGVGIPDDQQAVMRVYATTVKTTGVKRDTDVLTKEGKITHWKDLQAAMLEELEIWAK